jgi:hypothetical protein
LPDIVDELLALVDAFRDRRGDRQTFEEIKRRQDGKRRAAWARQAPARARAEARLAEARRGRLRRGFLGSRLVDRFAMAMVPGEWWGCDDVARAAGASRSARSKMTQVMLPTALVERARNPEWVPLAMCVRARVAQPPKWLYRLTVKGEALRALCLLLQ